MTLDKHAFFKGQRSLSAYLQASDLLFIRKSQKISAVSKYIGFTNNGKQPILKFLSFFQNLSKFFAGILAICI